MKKFEIYAEDKVCYTVLVEAEHENEALEKFRNGDFHDGDIIEHERFWFDAGGVAREV